MIPPHLKRTTTGCAVWGSRPRLAAGSRGRLTHKPLIRRAMCKTDRKKVAAAGANVTGDAPA